MATVKQDPKMTRRFLELFEPPGANFTFQSIHPDDRRLTRVLHGKFESHVDELTEVNLQGAGVFFMVNAGNGIKMSGAKTCRTNANVERVRAAFVDLDHASIDPLMEAAEPPRITVNTSPGKWHAYWCTDEIALPEFKGIQLALAKRFNGDPAVRDLARVMRLPGFVHWKAEPFMSRLVHPR